MPTKTYYLNDAQTETLTATWGMFFRSFEASYNGQLLGPALSADELRRDHQFSLPNGRAFSAQLRRSQGLQELELLLDGQPVPGSGTHPQERIKQAWYVLLFVGVLNVGLGLVAELGQVAVLLGLGLGWGSLVEGTAYLVLGWLGYARRSVPALTTAFVLLILDGALGIVGAVADGHGPGVGGLVARFFFCVIVFRSIKAAKQLRNEGAALATE